jgi:hypothetical protein
MMATLKDLAERREYLMKKIAFIEDLLTLAYSPEQKLQDLHGANIQDEVLSELDDKWLSPLRVVLDKLERLEIDNEGKAKKARKKKGS